jgi:LysR family transcriptional regulator, glycine cleavage system transcriptional activator
MARLPPLTTLQALEAAVRHRSYSKAARELNLTHGAISHQLRRLETDLGALLFRRSGNDMLPTRAAEDLADAITRCFADLERALDRTRRSAAGEPLVVSLAAQFASRWLAPRLPRLSDADLNVQLRVEDREADFVRDGVDAGVRLGAGVWEGLESAEILAETLFPICSPAFAERHGIATAEDLLRVPLLRPAFGAWSDWFTAQGLAAPGPEAPRSGDLRIEDSTLMIEAAAQGLGVALARSSLMGQDLTDGRLVRAAPGEVAAGVGFYLVWRADSRKLDRIGALRAWLDAEVAGVGQKAVPAQ